MGNLLKTPKIQLLITLLLIFLSAVINNPSILPVRNLLLILLTAITTEYICLKIRKISFFFPSAAIVSALIVTLLIAPNLPLYDILLTAILTIAAKNFLRLRSRHIFNPAALGLFVLSLLFHHNISWWAVSFQMPTVSNIASLFFFLVLLTPGLISMVRMRRYKITLSFLLLYVTTTSLISTAPLFTLLFDPTTLFFSLVMLPEPMTTPNKPKRQIAFGAFVACIAAVASLPLVTTALPFLKSIPDILVFSLLFGNAVFFARR